MTITSAFMSNEQFLARSQSSSPLLYAFTQKHRLPCQAAVMYAPDSLLICTGSDVLIASQGGKPLSLFSCIGSQCPVPGDVIHTPLTAQVIHVLAEAV